MDERIEALLQDILDYNGLTDDATTLLSRAYNVIEDFNARVNG